MPSGPAQSYLAKFNGYTLPGYVQQESFDSIMRVADNYSTYADGAVSEYTGLQNKMISLTMKVYEQDYATCKQQVRQAATILRSERGYAQLVIQDVNKYYNALVTNIKVEKSVGSSPRILEYVADFNCKPWQYSVSTYSVTNNSLGGNPGTLTTTGRVLDDGGWTPATVTITGTNVTVSGYTANNDFAGYFSVSGAVTNLVVDSDKFSATIGGVIKNNIMKTADYRIFVGPEVTNFYVTGATSCSVSWQNRWYL
jgi:hypothetical protein